MATDYETDCTSLDQTIPASAIHSMRAQCPFCEARWAVPARAAFGEDQASCRSCGMVQTLAAEAPGEAYFEWMRAGGPTKRPTPIQQRPSQKPTLISRIARAASGGMDL